MRRNPGEFRIYKKLGAAQFKPIPPRENEKGWIEKDGAILLEAGPGTPGSKDIQIDWSRKITFAIGIADIAILFDNLDSPKKLVHEQNGSVKTLEFIPATDERYIGTYMMKLFQKNADGTTAAVSVPMSGGEFMLLTRMLAQSAPYLIGWLD